MSKSQHVAGVEAQRSEAGLQAVRSPSSSETQQTRFS
jgi:hypothetical protein